MGDRNQHTMHHTPEQEQTSPNPLNQIRGAIMAAVFATLVATGCRFERSGPHIEISDPVTNMELEKLREEFVQATQRTTSDSNSQKIGKIRKILERRDKLLNSNGIPPKTETWYESEDRENGPFMRIRVDEKACTSAQGCTIKGPNSDFPEPPNN